MMKTWEVYKMALENPKVQVKRLLDNAIYELSEPGFLHPVGESKYFTITAHDEWELVQEPVSWQEAIQAWLDGKGFRVEMSDGAIITQDKARMCLGITVLFRGLRIGVGFLDLIRICLLRANGLSRGDET